MDFEKIKQTAKEKKCRVDELFALARNNDPFYWGTDAQIAAGEWFLGVWNDFGFNIKDEVHIREMHYVLISQREPVLMPDGKPYENTDDGWAFISFAAKAARWLGYVDPARFDDRRNGKPTIFTPVKKTPEIAIDGNFYFDFSMPDLPELPEYDVYLTAEQLYHLELWCEKSTMNKKLLPICEKYGANLVTGLGELSITSCLWLVDRVKEYGKPCRIFYISDFDPAGLSMPVAVSRKIEKFARDLDTDIDIKLFPIVLTHEQCIQYQLPRTPIKKKEKRGGRFESIYGEGATELDALEALHPGELKKIIEKNILQYFDVKLAENVWQARHKVKDDLEARRDYVIGLFADEISEIETEYAELKADVSDRFKALSEKIEDVWHAIQEELYQNAPDISSYDLPEPEVATEDISALYDSGRDYMEQLSFYKRFQKKET